MAKIEDLKGFCYPLTPEGRSSLIGNMPWYYGTEYLNIAYRADPDAIAAYLPAPLEPGPEPDMAYAAFSKWWSVWDGGEDMPSINPERTTYQEAAIWIGCSYKGEPGQMCLQIWVNNDFTMARGWFMGFPKKLGQVYITDYNPLNVKMPKNGPGVKYKGIAAASGQRLMEGSLTIERKIDRSELPAPMGRPLYHIRHFPSLVPGAKPSVLELVKLGAENWQYGEEVWAGKGNLTFYPSELEEHMPLAPKEIVGAYLCKTGYTFPGAEVVHDWLK